MNKQDEQCTRPLWNVFQPCLYWQIANTPSPDSAVITDSVPELVPDLAPNANVGCGVKQEIDELATQVKPVKIMLSWTDLEPFLTHGNIDSFLPYSDCIYGDTDALSSTGPL